MSETTNTLNAGNAVAPRNRAVSPLMALEDQGQSVWLDFISRDLVRGGALRRLIEQGGLRGITSNPSIFQKAIAAGSAYDAQIEELSSRGKTAGEIFEALSVQDVREACDLFRALYADSSGWTASSRLRYRPDSPTTRPAHCMRHAVSGLAWIAPNVLIKVPGTRAGTTAVQQLLTEGINVNITLLFWLENYARVTKAHPAALEARLDADRQIDRTVSVASFLVSRVDTLVDTVLDERIGAARQHGGAHEQRLPWASTSVKNPAYRDVLYVEELIGPDTVNTVPLDTIRAFEAHGAVARTVDRDVEDARSILRALEEVAGLDFDALTQQLEDEGLALFVRSYDDLITGVENKRGAYNHYVSSY